MHCFTLFIFSSLSSPLSSSQVLKECRLEENTIIIFSGDHGDMLGERGLVIAVNWVVVMEFGDTLRDCNNMLH